MNFQAKQAEFMVAAEQKVVTLADIMRGKVIPQQALMYMNLCEEEFKELELDFEKVVNADYADAKLAALAELLDSAGDLLYVVLGLCNSLGLPLHLAFDEIHKANMNKFVRSEDGSYKILKRADGKVVKPDSWNKPDIISILRYRLVVGE